MSDEEQQAPSQQQEEVKPENPDTINIKVLSSPVQLWRVFLRDGLNGCMFHLGGELIGRGSVLQDQKEHEAHQASRCLCDKGWQRHG